MTYIEDVLFVDGSLSSWRAWIEMPKAATSAQSCLSLSSWRAWIEIAGNDLSAAKIVVALLMESVD